MTHIHAEILGKLSKKVTPCMYVCTCIHVCMCVHTCMHVCTYIQQNKPCMYVCTYIQQNKQNRVCMCVHTYNRTNSGKVCAFMQVFSFVVVFCVCIQNMLIICFHDKKQFPSICTRFLTCIENNIICTHRHHLNNIICTQNNIICTHRHHLYNIICTTSSVHIENNIICTHRLSDRALLWLGLKGTFGK